MLLGLCAQFTYREFAYVAGTYGCTDPGKFDILAQGFWPTYPVYAREEAADDGLVLIDPAELEWSVKLLVVW